MSVRHSRIFTFVATLSLLVLGGSRASAADVSLDAALTTPPACACGCALFDADSAMMIPQGEGGRVYLEYDYADQHLNWSGTSRSPEYRNDDKQIETHWLTAGVQYMFTPEWGVQAEIEYGIRHFVTTADSGDIVSLHYNDLGDTRVKGIYAGFFEDHSAGVTFGFRLPTGNYSYEDKTGSVDRDSEIGTGSVDVLLGCFYHYTFTPWLTAFVTAQADLPVLDREHYYPGLEFDVAGGTFFPIPINDTIKVMPLTQMLVSLRTSDSGKASAQPVASGFERIFLSPGVELDVGPVMIFFDAEIPVFMHMTGQQQTAPIQFKAEIGYRF